MALELFPRVIRAYCDAAVTDAFSNQVRTACVEAVNVDPIYWMSQASFRVPLLAIWCTGGDEKAKTIGKQVITADYKLAYVLPRITTQQAQRITPLLLGVRKLISALCQLQGDDDDPTALLDAGICSITPGKWSIATLVTEQGQQGAVGDFPALLMDLAVEYLEDFDDSQAVTLGRVILALDIGPNADTAGTSTLPDFVTVNSDEE